VCLSTKKDGDQVDPHKAEKNRVDYIIVTFQAGNFCV
jgi:hypothetical protein